MEEITTRIKTLMFKKGITQTELARRLGISQAATSSRITRNITVASLLEILQAIGTTPAKFFQEAETPTQEEPTTTTAICPNCGKALKITIQ